MDITGGLCAYGCGRKATTLDHAEAVAKGGTARPGYMVPACSPCNSSKKDQDPAVWLERMTPDAWSIIGPTLTNDGPGLA